MPARRRCRPPASLATINPYLERKSIMTKQPTITFKVWLEIERFNEETGDGVSMNAPRQFPRHVRDLRGSMGLRRTRYLPR